YLVSRSSRFSRIGEEFGQSLGARAAVRDAVNTWTLGSPGGRLTQQADGASPHSISQVLTGAVYGVLRRSFRSIVGSSQDWRDPTLRTPGEVFRFSVSETMHRIGSMLYKGLDWLPPGEVSLAEYIGAVLAADRFHHPALPAERSHLIRECVHRRIAEEGELDPRSVEVTGSPVDPSALLQNRALAR